MHAAMADALTRAGAHFECPVGRVEAGWSDDLPVVSAWGPVGPRAAALPAGVLRLRRAWDEACWPHATRGFFQVRAAIPRILDTVAGEAA
ncbi:hypothetical protein AEGHOMDF_3749 [Methylobacterium soli]|nr:hypothetical protein AEGHOMDF_3749 [Methylobacterium soli]